MTFQSNASILRKGTLLLGRASVGTWGRDKATPQLRLSIPVRCLAGKGNQKIAHHFLPPQEHCQAFLGLLIAWGRPFTPPQAAPPLLGCCVEHKFLFCTCLLSGYFQSSMVEVERTLLPDDSSKLLSFSGSQFPCL